MANTPYPEKPVAGEKCGTLGIPKDSTLYSIMDRTISQSRPGGRILISERLADLL